MGSKKEDRRSKREGSEAATETANYGTRIQRSRGTPGQSGSYEPGGVIDERAGTIDRPHTSSRERNIQRALKGTDTSQDEVPEEVLDVVGSGGQPLDYPIQRALEDRMDADFSDVRIHTGGNAADAAEAIDAKAFTCGNDIVFNDGEYDPESPDGQHLLAHELAHVKQQNGGAPLSMMPQENADLEIDPDPQLERDAEPAARE